MKQNKMDSTLGVEHRAQRHAARREGVGAVPATNVDVVKDWEKPRSCPVGSMSRHHLLPHRLISSKVTGFYPFTYCLWRYCLG